MLSETLCAISDRWRTQTDGLALRLLISDSRHRRRIVRRQVVFFRRLSRHWEELLKVPAVGLVADLRRINADNHPRDHTDVPERGTRLPRG